MYEIINIFKSLWEKSSNDIIIGLIVTATFSLIIYIVSSIISFGKSKPYLLSSNIRKLLFFILKKKYVIIWNDHNIELSHKIASNLKKRGIKCKFRCIENTIDLKKYPLTPHYIQLILLIDTDVTKLSENESEREHLQLLLLFYVRKGGILLGSHDIIYRRCRHSLLQSAFGCMTNNFERFKKSIDVELVNDFLSHPLLHNLPTKFSLEDGEVCWGEWDKDVKILIQTQKRIKNNRQRQAPILTIRYTGSNGILIWLNSADKQMDLSASLKNLTPEIMQIFENAILQSDNIKKLNNCENRL
ncbi:hypothetical protein [Parabacteroides chinchillae]